MNHEPNPVPAPDVFAEVFALLTPERLLHDPRATGEGVTVCVIDSGVERRLLEEKFAQQGVQIYPIEGGVFTAERGEPLPYDGRQSAPHGTTVADVILTLAPRVRLFSADVFGPRGTCEVEVVIRALRWAIDVWKCKVVNLSLGVPEQRLQQVQRRRPAAAGRRGGVLQGRAGDRGGPQRPSADAQLPGGLRAAAVVGGQGAVRRPAGVRLRARATRSSSRRTAAATWVRSRRSRRRAGRRRTWPASPPASCRCGRASSRSR